MDAVNVIAIVVGLVTAGTFAASIYGQRRAALVDPLAPESRLVIIRHYLTAIEDELDALEARVKKWM